MKHYLVGEETMKATIQTLGSLPLNQVRALVGVLESCPPVNFVDKQPEEKKEPELELKPEPEPESEPEKE